jgi:hypothetical protein
MEVLVHDDHLTGSSPIGAKNYDGLNQLIIDSIEGPLGCAGPLTTTQYVYDFDGNDLRCVMK